VASRFVLLTAAKNEEQYISTVIESVLRQSVHPLAWFIMDDGSTDRTAEIVAGFAAQHPFIRLHSNRSGGKRSFGAQYRAINAAYALASHLTFDFIGVLDADIALASDDYFDRVLRCFQTDSALGITGGYIYELHRGEWRCQKANSPDSVAGGVQMFRRTCYEQIGGYTPLLFGGEDWLAQLDARIAGWRVAPQINLPVHHHRPTSSADGHLRGRFRQGMMDRSFGSHPVFEMLKCARRVIVGERPLLLSGIVRFVGYIWCCVTMRGPWLPAEKVAYLRREQMNKVYNFVRFVGPTMDSSSSSCGAKTSTSR
jgi:glycosyltransferase involved in cell wall biosynthesis